LQYCDRSIPEVQKCIKSPQASFKIPSIMLNITDCPASLMEYANQFKKIVEKTQGFILVYSIESEESLAVLEKIITHIAANALSQPLSSLSGKKLGHCIPIIILGNKSDIDDPKYRENFKHSEKRRMVYMEQVQLLADKYGIQHFAECASRWNSHQIPSAFGEMALMILNKKLYEASSSKQSLREKCTVM